MAMEVITIGLLLVTIIGQSKCWFFSQPPEKPGQVITILEETEQLQWQKVGKVLSNSGRMTDAYVWNEEVTMKNSWSNNVSTFFMTCAENKGSFRAIIFFKTEDSDVYNTMKTMDVLTCEADLLRSVSIVREKWGWGQFVRIFIVDVNKICKMDVFGLKHFRIEYINQPCPEMNSRGSTKNRQNYINGWIELQQAEKEMFKDRSNIDSDIHIRWF